MHAIVKKNSISEIDSEEENFEFESFAIENGTIQSGSLIMNIRLLWTNLLVTISFLDRICIESSSLNMKYLYYEQIFLSPGGSQ